MKKLCKRGFALLFALSLLLTLGLSALAEGGDAAAAAPADARKIFVSAAGSDQTGAGTETAPYASLARAAAAANETPDKPVCVILLTDLEAKETARFTGRNVTIQAAKDSATVTRAQGFAPARDAEGRLYHPSMIQLCCPESGKTAGTLTLLGVILDDAGRHEGTVFERPTAKTAAPTETPAAETPAAETPAAETPAEETPAAETPAAETPAEEAPEGDGPTEEPPADPPAEESPAPPSPTPEQPAPYVQEAIVLVEAGGRLVLGSGAELRNFGGMTAVRLGENAGLTLESGSAIRDTKTVSNKLPAVTAPGSARVEVKEGAVLAQRSDDPVVPNLRELPYQGFSDLSFTGPESITQGDESTASYDVDYSLEFTVSSALKEKLLSKQDSITKGEGTITVKLDSRLTPDPAACVLSSGVFELDGEPSLDSGTLTVRYKLKDDWKDHLDELDQPMTLSVPSTLSAENFSPSTAEKEEYLESSAGLTFQANYKEGEEDKTIKPQPSEEKTARTLMLGQADAAVIYDVNGGDEGSGPATEQVSEQPAYTLSTDPTPTHAPQDSLDVVFIGWSLTADTKIYDRGDSLPSLVETIAVTAGSSTTVYAVYGIDANSDGIADLLQDVVFLSFDANGGQNAPAPIPHIVGSIGPGGFGVDIPQEEPNRDYYSFVGWGKTKDAGENDRLYKYDAEDPALRDIPVTEDTTLYAVWKENYKIIYDANGGQNGPDPTVLKTQAIKYDKDGNPVYDKNGNICISGRAAITDQQPTRNGYTFKGWATTRRGTAVFHAGDAVEITNGNVTLYAVWVRGNSGGAGGGGGGGAGKPKTGDTDPGLYYALMGGALLGLTGIGAYAWKKRRS